VIPAGNLVKNGSFEDPVITSSHHWNVLAPGQLPEWTILSTRSTIKAEIQEVGISSWRPPKGKGSQWLELDGDENGPGKKWDATAMGRAEEGLYAIRQTLVVEPGKPYALMFDFAARPGTKQIENEMQFSVLGMDDKPLKHAGGDDVAGVILAAPHQIVAKSTPPVWQTATEIFVAPASGQVKIEFEGLGPNNTYGMFLDNVVVVPADLPVVSIKAIDDVAHELYGETGTYVITRESGRVDVTVPVQIIVSGDAGYGFHYQLSPDLPPLPVDGDGHQSTISLLPGVERLYVTLTPLPEDTDNKLRRATIELRAPEIPLYSIAEGYESATVTIIPADQRDLIISGRITYEGPTGVENDYALTFGPLPVRAAKVEIWDKNGGLLGGNDQLVGTTYTDDNGRYEIVISSVDTVAGGGFVDPYVVVVAQSAPEDVVTIAHEVAIPGGTAPAQMRFVKDEDVTSQGPGTLTLDGAITDNGNRNENGAFSVFDAIYSASRYHVTLPGVGPGTVNAELIAEGKNQFTRDGRIQILTTSRFGWDTIGHEYGHFAHKHAGVALAENDHYFTRNMRFGRPVQGWWLAFTEGFATYFSLVAQARTPKPPTGVAGFGDTEYWGMSPLGHGLWLGSRTDIEAGGPTLLVTPEYERTMPVSLGDDNEVSVFRVLWDLYDPANDDPIGDIGDVGVWVLVVGVGAEARELPEFYSVYRNLTAEVDTERVWEIGQVLAAHNMVPSPLRVDYGADFTPPTFVVSALYGSTHGEDQDQWLFDSVDIRFYSDTGEWIEIGGSTAMSIPVDQSPEISWTPTSDQWFELIVGGVDRWSVVATTKAANGRVVSQYESFARTVAFG
jgi:hypothetical protein